MNNPIKFRDLYKFTWEWRVGIPKIELKWIVIFVCASGGKLLDFINLHLSWLWVCEMKEAKSGEFKDLRRESSFVNFRLYI